MAGAWRTPERKYPARGLFSVASDVYYPQAKSNHLGDVRAKFIPMTPSKANFGVAAVAVGCVKRVSVHLRRRTLPSQEKQSWPQPSHAVCASTLDTPLTHPAATTQNRGLTGNQALSFRAQYPYIQKGASTRSRIDKTYEESHVQIRRGGPSPP